MLSILSGLACAGASGASLWYFLPRNGKTHPLIVKPFFDWAITVGILMSFAFGLALVLNGLS